MVSLTSILTYVASEEDFFKPAYEVHHSGVALQDDICTEFVFKDVYVDSNMSDERHSVDVSYSPMFNGVYIRLNRHSPILFEAIELVLGLLSTSIGDLKSRPLMDMYDEIVTLIQTNPAITSNDRYLRTVTSADGCIRVGPCVEDLLLININHFEPVSTSGIAAMVNEKVSFWMV